MKFPLFPSISQYFSTTQTCVHFFLNEGGNTWTRGEFGQFAEFSCSRYPSQGTQAMLTQDKETKKVWTLQPKPSQRSSLRSSTGKVQECSLTQWLHNPTSCTCAALQWQRSSTEEQQAATSAAGKLRSISLICRLHNTITLHLTAVKSKSRASVKSKSKISVNIHVLFQ